MACSQRRLSEDRSEMLPVETQRHETWASGVGGDVHCVAALAVYKVENLECYPDVVL